jgi:D-3-phosphoglycerate dehydrogenase
LKNGTITNAVNVPSVTGELLKKLGPYLYLGEKMGRLQSQIICGPITEVNVEYLGDFQGLNLSPVTTSAIKGLLTSIVKDDVNFINAPVLAKERGIKISESFSADAENYINLIRFKVVTTEMTSKVSGTIFGKKDARIVEINRFRLEVIPEGHAAIIQNLDKPGAIGSIGTTLGKHHINISKMHVGQEEEGNNNIIYLRTDTPMTPEALKEIRSLPLINWITPLEL